MPDWDVARSAWTSSPRPPVIATPVQGNAAHHSVTPEWLGVAAARNLDRIARERGFNNGASYTGGWDRQGTTIELRGWGRQGAHTQGHNSTMHGLVAVGNYDSNLVPDGSVRGAVRCVRAAGRYGPGRFTHTHAQLGSTACPGRYFTPRIPAINAAAAGGTTPPPSGSWFDMATEAQLRSVVRSVMNEGAVGTRNWAVTNRVMFGNVQATRGHVEQVPTATSFGLHVIAAVRFCLSEAGLADGVEGQDLTEVAEFVASAVTDALPSVLADLTPEAIADAVTAALPADMAGQVVDELAGRLAETVPG